MQDGGGVTGRWGAGGGGGANYVQAPSPGGYTVTPGYEEHGGAPAAANTDDPDFCLDQDPGCRAGYGGTQYRPNEVGMVVVRVSANNLAVYREAGCGTWKVPAGVNHAMFKLWGAGGARAANEAAGPGGGFQVLQLTDLREDEDLTVYVGGPGEDSFVARDETVLAVGPGGPAEDRADVSEELASGPCGFYFNGEPGTDVVSLRDGGPMPANIHDFHYRWPAGRGASGQEPAQAGLVVVVYKPES
jgi:hypothetical protein